MYSFVGSSVPKFAARLLSSLLLCLLVGETALQAPARAAALGPAHPTQVKWNLTPAEIAANCKTQLAKVDARIKQIMALKGPRTFANTVLPLEDAEADINDKLVAEGFLFNTSIDKPTRDASEKCGTDQSNYFTEIGARPDIYQAIAAVKKSNTAKTVYDRKLVDLYLIAFQRSGAALSPEKRKEFVKLSNDLTDLGNKFSGNLGNDRTTITITAAQAASLPTDFVQTLKKSADGTYTVNVNESTASTFFENEKDPQARKTYYLAYQNRAGANVAILEKAIGVRDRLAHLMGYQTWAAYVLADRMAGSPPRVLKFLESLDAKLFPKARANLAAMAALKAQDTGNPNATMDAWDVSYYNNMLNKTKYAVDNEAIKQYFPVSTTIDRIMNLYHKLLGVSFVKVEHPDSWDPETISYNVFDTKSGRFIGTTFFDLFPRPGKFTHFANWPLMPARRLADGSYRPPITAILGNWPKPAPGKPALLSHEDVETFFHEFGHDMATLLATTPYETLSSGFRQDFVEAPSQMLENWVWDPQILKEISSHVETHQGLPDDVTRKIIAARYVDNAYFTTRQILLADTDLAYHTGDGNVDTTAIWASIAREKTPTALPPGIHPEAQFGHLMGGYDAGYSGYLWSKVYAQDLFTAFVAGGLESPAVGARYRREILQPAREREPDAEVQRFLGRPVNPDAFYREFGIDSKQLAK